MKTPEDLDEKLYDTAFEFLLGFFLLPFTTFTVVVTVNLMLRPNFISDGTAFLYIALLTGVYYTFKRDKNSIIYFGDSPTTTPRVLGLLTFLLLALSFYLNDSLNWSFS